MTIKQIFSLLYNVAGALSFVALMYIMFVVGYFL